MTTVEFFVCVGPRGGLRMIIQRNGELYEYVAKVAPIPDDIIENMVHVATFEVKAKVSG
jgi:hypothetical protein